MEDIFNIFLFVENGVIYELGAVVHQKDGSDEEKSVFLRSQVENDASRSRRFSIPNRYKIIDPDTNTYISAIKYEKFRVMQRMGIYAQIFEEVFQYFDASRNPLLCCTPVVEGEIKIDEIGKFKVIEDANPEAIKEVRFFSKDYLIEYYSEAGFDFSRLFNDDYFEAIKLLFRNGHYVSALKLLLSCIDTMAYLEYGDKKSIFVKWLDNYADFAELGITSIELWEMRNSLLHMTNLDSRKVQKGDVRRISFYVGELKRGLPDESDEAKYFNLSTLYDIIAHGAGKWINSFNDKPEKYSTLFERYDRIVSDSRYLTAEIE